jgi:hypothetical protein
MPLSSKFLLAVVLGAVASALPLSTPASAGGACLGITVSCENGRSYALCPIAVSDEGDLVTAHFTVTPRGMHVRLVPMGVGYRYIGPDIWLDGVREQAILHFGKNSSVACTVVRG